MEVQESLLINGDHESLTGGNPDLITGWTNAGLDAGDTEAEAVVVHSGAQSLEWNVGAASEGMYLDGAIATIGKYYYLNLWVFGSGTRGIAIGSNSAARGVLQADPSSRYSDFSVGVYWAPSTAILRALDATFRPQINAVSLTVTPASEANSLEGTGLRIDGHDDVTQPDTLNILRQTYGAIGVFVTPRHDINVPFGQAGAPDEAIFTIRNGANNIYVFRQTGVGRLRLQYEIAGGGAVAVDYNPGGNWWPADDKRFLAVRWTPVWIRAWLDGVLTHDIAVAVAFALDFTTIYWGPQPAAVNRYPDMVFSST
jgi:hypothetical protein